MINADNIKTQLLPWTIMELACKVSLTKKWLRLVNWLNSLLISAHLSDRLYHLICSLTKSNSAQLTLEVPIPAIDKFRASMKSNPNKHENVKTWRLVIDSCPVDHNKEGLTNYELLCYHNRVQRRYGCGERIWVIMKRVWQKVVRTIYT